MQDLLARRFYEAQALSSGWSVRQLDRQIASQFYERSKVVRRNLVVKSHPEDDLTPDEHIRDPFVLEFLGLKDEYSEHELEEALILRLEHFLLRPRALDPARREPANWVDSLLGAQRGSCALCARKPPKPRYGPRV